MWRSRKISGSTNTKALKDEAGRFCAFQRCSSEYKLIPHKDPRGKPNPAKKQEIQTGFDRSRAPLDQKKKELQEQEIMKLESMSTLHWTPLKSGNSPRQMRWRTGEEESQRKKVKKNWVNPLSI